MASAPQRAKTLRFIEQEILSGRPFPTPSAIADHLRCKSVSSIYGHLHALTTLGYLFRTKNGARYSFSPAFRIAGAIHGEG
jgi:SOS-response transcriptional repressor LexA